MCVQQHRSVDKFILERKNDMKIKCSKKLLNEIVNIVQKAIAAKSAHPIMECIKIEAESDNHVTFTANSIELCIEYNSEIEVSETGSIALTSKIFGEIVRRLPEGEVYIAVDPKNYLTEIKCDQSEFNIQGQSAAEFPDAPIIDEQYRTTMSQKELKKIIRKVQPFISQNETRKPVLMGALFDFKGNELKVVGTDSHRLAVISCALETETEPKKFVVPGATLSKISQLLTEDDENVDIIVSEKNILFDFKDYQVYSRLLEGEFLKYEVILSATNSIRVLADKQEITDSLERANLIINDEMSSKTENKVPVRMNIAYNKIDISCRTGKGNVNDTVNVEHDGGDLLIGFNCRFMLDALNACDDETVLMEFSAPTSGCFIRPGNGGDNYTFMILPVRLYN